MAFDYFGMLMVRVNHWKKSGKMRKKLKGDFTYVLEDFTASVQTELSVTRGQQVEVLDALPGPENFCLVRNLPKEDGMDSVQGLVPIPILKPVPCLQGPGYRSSMDLDDEMGAGYGSSSPAAKRRSSFRKWLTNPVRKLGHSKVDRSTLERIEAQKIAKLEKKVLMAQLGAEKKWRKESKGHKGVHWSEAQTESGHDIEQPITVKTNLEVTSEELEPAQDIEMPPPMAEIQDLTQFSTQEPLQDDVHTNLASKLTLKPQTENISTLELASELENIVKYKHDPSIDRSTPSIDSSDAGKKENGESSNQHDEKDVDTEREKYLQKRKFVVRELIDTERDYVRDLGLIVHGYKVYIQENPLSAEMEGKDKIVFGNIHQIYDWHKETFLPELEKCIEQPERIGLLFTKYERRLHMYVKYCENKPKSEFIVAEYLETYFEDVRQKLGHRLLLPDLLIKPVQRIMKYQLILKDISKYTEKAGLDSSSLRNAYKVMCIVPKAANDMMQVGRLQGFDGKITGQGRFLLQETMLVSEIVSGRQQKFQERRVFLFEQIIIFSEMIEKKRGNFSNQNYVYKNSVKVNKMSMTDRVENEPLRFMIIDRTPCSDIKYIIQAATEEIKSAWVAEVKTILDMQGDFLRALQSPIAYQKEITKELSAPDIGQMNKDAALRKTVSHPQSASPGFCTLPLHAANKNPRNNTGSPKHSRCCSVPGPMPVEEEEKTDKQKYSCPNSPIDTVLEKQKGNSLERQRGNNSGSPKPKKNLLDGFRNARKKSKNDIRTSDIQEGDADVRTNNGSGEMHSASGKNSGGESSESEPGMNDSIVQGRVICDYTAVKEDEVSVMRGEIVQILSTNQQNMFLVHRPANEVSPAAEGWVPGHVVGPKDPEGGSLRKTSWQMFKGKKMNKTDKKGADGMNSLERRSKTLGRDTKLTSKTFNSDFLPEVSPTIHQPLTSLTVQAGDTAVLTCKICGKPRPNLIWRYQGSHVLSPGPRMTCAYTDDGVATLQIFHVSPADSGEYSCSASSEMGSVITRANLTVLDRPGPPCKPVIRNQVGTAVHLEWSPPSQTQCGQIQGYTVEYKEVGVELWQAAIPYVPNTSQVIADLNPGSVYQFRVSAHNAVGISEPSLPSEYVSIPTEFELTQNDEIAGAIWKATFENDFTEIQELGRGRFSVVKKCMQQCSGEQLAVKCISRKLVSREAVETEFNTLQSLQHMNLLQVYDLYENATSYIIIMQPLFHGRLFDYICGRQHFDEVQAADYMKQLLEVTHYLHNCRIAHLDIKPENLLVEVDTVVPCVKLIDFGDARHIYNNYYVHPMVGSPEFMAPEIVNGKPVGLLTDIWSIGIVLYVLLSGVSPFLDESSDETCSNIIRNDYCFPDEYFAGISSEAKELIRTMLLEDLSKRPTAQSCIESNWIKKASIPRSSPLRPKPIATNRLADFIGRRSHQSDACL